MLQPNIRRPLPPAKLVAGGWVRVPEDLMRSRVEQRVPTLIDTHHVPKLVTRVRRIPRKPG